MSELANKAISSMKWLAAVKWTTQAVSWMSTIVVARFLDPTDYGTMGLTITFVGFLELSNELGLGAALVQKEELNEKILSSAFWMILALSLLLYLIAFLIAPLAAGFYDNLELGSLIRVLALNLVIWAFGVIPENLLVKELEFKTKSLLEAFGRILSIIVTLAMAVYGYGVWSLAIGQIVFRGSYTIGLLYRKTWRPQFHFSRHECSDILKFGGTVVAGRYLYYFHSRSAYLIGGKFLSPQDLGYYTLAHILSVIPVSRVSSLINQISFPLFSKLQNDTEQLRKTYIKITELYSLIIFPCFVGLALGGEAMIPMLFGEKWITMIPPFKILCLVGAFKSISALGHPLVWAIGKPGIATSNDLLGICIMPAAFLIGVQYGVMGLAYASLIAFPFLFMMAMSRIIKHINMTIWQLISLLKFAILSSGILLLTCWLIAQFIKIVFINNAYLVVTAQIIFGMAIYTGCIYLFQKEKIGDLKKLIFKS